MTTPQKELGVDIIPFEEMVYLPFEDEYRPSGNPLKPTAVLSKSMWPPPSRNVKPGTEKACTPKPGPVF